MATLRLALALALVASALVAPTAAASPPTCDGAHDVAACVEACLSGEPFDVWPPTPLIAGVRCPIP